MREARLHLQDHSIESLRACFAEQGIELRPDELRGWGPAYHMRGRTLEGGVERTGLVGFIAANTRASIMWWVAAE